MPKNDTIFKSDTQTGNAHFQIASGYISETSILFENENVVAVIEAKGQVSFYNTSDDLLAQVEVPAVKNGKGVYEEVLCQVKDNLIEIQFPIYEWIDNYPHCDGEYDRWDTRIVGYHTVTYDRLTNLVK